jgi:hypothetical protein
MHYQEKLSKEYILNVQENFKMIRKEWISEILYGLFYLKKIKQLKQASNIGLK